MNKNTVDFVFGLHFHQPVGNFGDVLEGAYNDAYLPFIETFKKFDNLKMCLHISSPLLEYFQNNHPEFIRSIAGEVRKGKIEMLGGGFYEPILISIPERDLRGQFRMMDDFLLKHFGQKPRGIWLTERVWEGHIPTMLKGTGIDYLAVDDTHFIQAGFTPSMLRGYYMSEDRGNKTAVFPINKTLRYMIPFEPVDKIINTFRKFSKESSSPLLCMLDDGEKFGVWPDTKEWVYGKNWLEKFFSALQENSSWLKMRTLSQCHSSRKPLGRAYLPSCSYYEMLQWSMPVEGATEVENIKELLKEKEVFETVDPYITGGIWRNFMSKYPESNYMHKKMLYLSRRLEDEKKNFPSQKALREARKSLYRAQCNCPYWHGVFGGLYLSHLRESIYNNLNKLHRQLEEAADKGKFACTSEEDIDCDGSREVLIDTDSLFICVKPAEGGRIEEISDKKNLINYVNTITRRKEFYHADLLKENDGEAGAEGEDEGIASIHSKSKKVDPRIKELLVYDKYQRRSLIDHILPSYCSREKFFGPDFQPHPLTGAECEYEILSGEGKAGVKLSKTATGLTLSKILESEGGSREFSCAYSLSETGTSGNIGDMLYGAEFNFSMLSIDEESKYLTSSENSYPLSRNSEIKGIKKFTIHDDDRNFKIEIKADSKFTLWSRPLKTVTNSEAGSEITYQTSCFVMLFPLSEAKKGGNITCRIQSPKND